MIPPNIKTSTREVPLAPELREERQAYVREKWVPPASEHQPERKNACTITSCVANATYSKDVTQKLSMLTILKEGDHT